MVLSEYQYTMFLLFTLYKQILCRFFLDSVIKNGNGCRRLAEKWLSLYAIARAALPFMGKGFTSLWRDASAIIIM